MAAITLDFIKNDLETNGWKLVSQKYTNLQTGLEMVCPNKHLITIPYGIWRKNNTCPICAESSKNILKPDVVVAKKKDTVRLLALDQATTLSGWAIFDGEQLIQYGKNEVSGPDVFERIHEVKKWVCNLINNWKPDYVAIEDIQLQSFGSTPNNAKYSNDGVTTYKVLAQLQGVLVDLFVAEKIKFNIVHSAKWRSSCNVVGKTRNDKKKSAQTQVEKWYGIKPTQDEADAICIGKHTASKILKNQKMIVWGE